MDDHTHNEGMTRHLFIWTSRLDLRCLRKLGDARRRKLGRLRRIKPPWKKAA